MKFQRTTFLAGASVAALLLAGCGGGTSATTGAGGAGADGKGEIKGDIQASWWAGSPATRKPTK